jgi:hypothetical protein
VAEPRPKRKQSAKELANLRRPHDKKLPKVGRTTSREYVIQSELDFLNYLLDGATKVDAWRWAGYMSNSDNCYQILQRPLIQRTFKELEDRRKEQSVQASSRRFEERSEFVHKEFIYRMRTAQTHEKIGDIAIAKMLEVGFKSTGAIQPAKVSATANASAQAEAGVVDIYKPLWLRESEAQLIAQARQQSSQPQLEAPRILLPERAKEYLAAAGGDKERAREAARKDGWQV